LIGNVSEIALPIGRSGYQNVTRTRPDDLPRTLVISEEKQLVRMMRPPTVP
jgi:hypothetical protein